MNEKYYREFPNFYFVFLNIYSKNKFSKMEFNYLIRRKKSNYFSHSILKRTIKIC